MKVRTTPPTTSCPVCATVNRFDAAQCVSCGRSLATLSAEAATVELPPLERDPLINELWHQLREATIGEFDIYAPIGRGGMATVFLGLDLALDREVALKVIAPTAWNSPTFLERFKREAKTAAALSHPNIIPIHAVRETGGLVFFVMKYVNGRSLDSIISEQGAMPIDLVLNVIAQVGAALNFAHRKGVVHRDVKPANVMIDQDGWALVTDFGIAKVSDAGTLTSAGMVVGTPAYMSPEQFTGAPVTGNADQYSLGVLMYEMLTGSRPFTAATVAEMMRAHMLDEPKPPKTVRADIPDSVATMVQRMMAKEPAERFASIGEALETLEPLSRSQEEQARVSLQSLARTGSTTRPRISVPISPAVTRRSDLLKTTKKTGGMRRWGLRGLGVALVVLAVTGAGYLYTLLPGSRTADPTSTSSSLAAGRGADPAVPAPPPSVTSPADTSKNRAANSARDSIKPNPQASRGTAGVSKAPDRRGATPPPSSGQRAADAQRGTASKPDTQTKVATQAESTFTPPVTPPAPVAAPLPTTGFIRLGTRIPNAVLYLGDDARGFIGGLRYIEVPWGTIRIGIGAEGCTKWDTSVVVQRGDTVRIGFRSPGCR